MIKTSLTQLTAALKSLDLPKNHIYIVHSSMLKFGLLEGGLQGALGCLQQVLGQEATILMPAFTFSFNQAKVWDYRNTKAETGALTEYFRKLPGVQRTIHPFHSLSVSGPLAEKFIACQNVSSFGPGSPFSILYDLGAINIALGTEFEGGATFLHHTEEIAQVPYRFYKDFSGTIIDSDGSSHYRIYKMYVRKIEKTYQYVNMWEHVWNDMAAYGLVSLRKVNGANLFAMQIRASHDWFLDRLRADPFYCAKKQEVNK